MIEITEITDDPKQKMLFVGENQEQITFTLTYQPTQQLWVYSLEYLDFTLNGCTLLNSPNMLRKYKNILPFGISCVVKDGAEPYFLDDFTTKRVTINLLNESEVEQIEGYFST